MLVYMRTLSDLSEEEISILQIMVDGDAFHKLNILNQLKQFATFAGKEFDIHIAQKNLDRLTEEKFLIYLPQIESYRLTDAGHDVLES